MNKIEDVLEAQFAMEHNIQKSDDKRWDYGVQIDLKGNVGLYQIYHGFNPKNFSIRIETDPSKISKLSVIKICKKFKERLSKLGFKVSGHSSAFHSRETMKSKNSTYFIEVEYDGVYFYNKGDELEEVD
jgi:hypothetical protein